MKIDERGRGKFKPAPDYSLEDVRNLLLEKIEEEKDSFESSSHSIDSDALDYDRRKFNLLSLFAGCGGLDLGFEIAGLDAVIGEEETDRVLKDKELFNEVRRKSVFHTIFANDFFAEAAQSYELNFPKHVLIDNNDIRKIRDFPNADIVLGGFPCPGFSEAGPRLIDDERNFLYLHFIRCLLQSKPAVFVAENVKGMMTLGKGEVFRQIVQDFSAAGYRVYHKLLNASHFGVPQIRERVFLVGIRTDLDYEYRFPTETHGEGMFLKPVVTLKDSIWDLRDNPGPFFTGSFSSIYMSRNRKKSWDEPSFTIQASGRHAPIHPDGEPMERVGKNEFIFTDGEENNRRLSVKEIARIQTFPDWFEFSQGTNSKRSENGRLDLVYKQIGNAVPVQLARVVARPIAQWAMDYLRAQGRLDEKSVEAKFIAQ